MSKYLTVKTERNTTGLHRRRKISPLALRILAINIATLLIPVGGLLYLGPYRDALIESELEALKIQADTFSGAIGEGAVQITQNGKQFFNPIIARKIIWRLSAPSGLRSRLFRPDGRIVADSRYLMNKQFAVRIQALPSNEANWLPRTASRLMDWISSLIPKSREFEALVEQPNARADEFVEALAALSGAPTVYVRRSEDDALVLSVAVPVQRYRHILGALMVSKDDTAIKAAITGVRLTILNVFGAALVITILLSMYLAGTLLRPIVRLAIAAERVRCGVGRGKEEIPDFTNRNDEIGDLSGVLREMTGALNQRLEAIEKFAADVSHEIKNPLTSLRSAVETASRVQNPEQQRKLMTIIQDDVQRLDRLITDISNASRLDAEISRFEMKPTDVCGMLVTLCEIYCADETGPKVLLKTTGLRPFYVAAQEDRLVQVFRNVIQNAISFSPPDGQVVLHLTKIRASLEIEITDDGPGLPAEKFDAVFDRFYSERPEGEKFGTHSGLGLSISKQIIEAHGGSISAENRSDSKGKAAGARFIIRLPILGN